jgi:hypothetical protein
MLSSPQLALRLICLLICPEHHVVVRIAARSGLRGLLEGPIKCVPRSRLVSGRTLGRTWRRRGWEIAGEYVDAGMSGTRERRPEFDRMLAACKRRQSDAVVVYRYDRFARSLRQLVNALCEFDDLGIQFISVHEGWTLQRPTGA